MYVPKLIKLFQLKRRRWLPTDINNIIWLATVLMFNNKYNIRASIATKLNKAMVAHTTI